MIIWKETVWTQTMPNGAIVNPSEKHMWFDYAMVTASGGNLQLYADTSPRIIHHWDGKVYNPSVACATLSTMKEYTYGKFSAEIMLPQGRNLWPAFWLCGAGSEDWPAVGEFDIMEAWSGKRGYFKPTIPQFPWLVPSWNTTNNVHWAENGQHCYTGSRRTPLVKSLKNPAKHFVKYELEWRQDIIIFRVGGKVTRIYGYDIAKHLHDKKMHVIFDLWTTSPDFELESPMIIKDFKYEPIELL